MKRLDTLRELRDLSPAALIERSSDLGEELMKLRFREASGQLEQSHQLTTVRRNLARVQTVLREKETSASV